MGGALREEGSSGLNKPTPTQLRYLAALANGLNMVRIAELSDREYATIRTTLANVRDRLGTTNNTQSVVTCIAHGWLELDGDSCMVAGDPEGWRE